MGNTRIEIADVAVDAQTRGRSPGEFEFRAPHIGIVIFIERAAINYLRDLVVLVIIEERIRIDRQSATSKGIFHADLKGVYALGTECCRLRNKLQLVRIGANTRGVSAASLDRKSTRLHSSH